MELGVAVELLVDIVRMLRSATISTGNSVITAAANGPRRQNGSIPNQCLAMMGCVAGSNSAPGSIRPLALLALGVVAIYECMVFVLILRAVPSSKRNTKRPEPAVARGAFS